MTQPTPNPWDQQPEETDKTYEYFRAYRDQGRTRTLAKTGQTFTKTAEWMRILSSEHNWVKRAQAWDAEQDQQWAKELQDERRKMAKEHVQVANSMMEKVFQKLDQLDLDEIKPSDLAKWVEVAAKTKRLAVGEPETLQITGPGGGPIQTEDLTKLTIEERKKRLTQLKNDIEKRIAGD